MVVAPPAEAATATVITQGSMVPVNAYSVNYFDDNKQVLKAYYKVIFYHHFNMKYIFVNVNFMLLTSFDDCLST